MVDHQRVVTRVSNLIAEHPRKVVAAFLVITLVMATGMGNITTETGTQQFSEGTASEEALKDIDREFGEPFAADSGTTQVIQEEANVLSKSAMLRMLRAQERVLDRTELRVTNTRSSAQQVARQLDPTATTVAAQIRAIERATPSEIDAAVRRAAAAPGFTGALSKDFNRESARAGASIAVITHEIPTGLSGAWERVGPARCSRSRPRPSG
ncbi:MAG: hypothetical protein U5K70_07835 [Halodesulfurarchaeum sp.]|nr:hypothetical protein [Halodesulfurarchaeum sp.]